MDSLRTLAAGARHPFRTPGSVARWAAVGAVTMALDIGIFSTATAQNWSAASANLVAIPVSTAFNYAAHHSWSFKSSQPHTSTLPKFLANLAFLYASNTVLVSTLLNFGLTPALSKIATMPVQIPLNYLVLRRWVFRSGS